MNQIKMIKLITRFISGCNNQNKRNGSIGAYVCLFVSAKL